MEGPVFSNVSSFSAQRITHTSVNRIDGAINDVRDCFLNVLPSKSAEMGVIP